MATEDSVDVLPDVPTILGVPLNRIITFVGPYVALVAGVIATAIISSLHVTVIPHDQLATGIANVIAFAVSSGLVWLGQQQWLKGHHIQLANLTPDLVVTETSEEGDFEDEDDDPDGVEFVPPGHSQEVGEAPLPPGLRSGE